ncbi:hypothetical protein BCR37DRAFT_164583 [Protomyces lactucae-debilis]|uniref:Uncharacterized protein n=1 Tax=Protomyces lactucae-debilis TaxID=2754530 RepID=A0A1Y2EXK3_PROLT|nr:uncharacterized protein BCR37DRAFT_164583 [Protomyces lactucae-debilis]ORY76341.1 hypothetical protein BCR37DRAFT_164583 [Protomyces lactucae-debilis]
MSAADRASRSIASLIYERDMEATRLRRSRLRQGIAAMFGNNLAVALRDVLDGHNSGSLRGSSRTSTRSTSSSVVSESNEASPAHHLATTFRSLTLTSRPSSTTRLFRRRAERTSPIEAPPPAYSAINETPETSFQPSAEILAQSRRNFLESSGICVLDTNTVEAIGLHRLEAQQQRREHQQQLLTGRSTVDTPHYEADRRETRRGGKYLFAPQDTVALAEINQHTASVRAGCSSHALAVSSRAEGFVSIVEEFHGFVHQSPLVVRISTVPVVDEPEVRQVPTTAIKQTKHKKNVKEQWSAFVVQSKGNFIGMPPLPLERLLRIKQPDLFASAESGDILLEGSYNKARSLYVQDMSGSLSSHVSVVYREPITRALYLLTSRTWSKRFRNAYEKRKQQHDLASLDFKTLQCTDGVTLHPLEAYVAQARQAGSYFLLRKLMKGKKAPSAIHRHRLGQKLFEWFLANQGTRPPPVSEEILRLKGACKVDAKLSEVLGLEGLATGQEKLVLPRNVAQVTQRLAFHQRGKYAALLNKTTDLSMSSSEAVLAALEHADVFDLGAKSDAEAARVRRVMSSSNMFELRRLPLRPTRHANGFGGWGYEILTLVTGEKQQTGVRGYVTSVSSHGRVEMSIGGQPLNFEEGAV